MAKIKHTPGPWTYGATPEWTSEGGAARLKPSKRGWFISPVGHRKNGDNYDIAEVHCTSSQDRERQEANARLIALAPRMFTALQLAAASLDAAGFDNATIRLVRAIIAEAEGKTQGKPKDTAPDDICCVCGAMTGLCCSEHDHIVPVCANCACPECKALQHS